MDCIQYECHSPLIFDSSKRMIANYVLSKSFSFHGIRDMLDNFFFAALRAKIVLPVHVLSGFVSIPRFDDSSLGNARTLINLALHQTVSSRHPSN
jgi:hypothetical protein